MMKRFLGLLIAGVFVASGCSQAPTQQEEATVFDEEFGGYTAGPEAAAFGDEQLLAEAGDEVDPGDPEATLIETDQADAPERHLVFVFRAVWGQLRFDSTSRTPTDWTGGLVIDDGRIGVRRTIRFEPATDYLKPRTAPNIVEWASITTVHNDGILALISVRLPAPDPTVMTTDPLPPEILDSKLHFRTGPLSISFTLRELVTLDTAIRVDDAGNAVLFNGMLVRPRDCPRGFLGGHWMRNEEGTGGEFKGRWVATNGDRMGSLVGRYGVNANGRRVFFGKVVNEAGEFLALMRGVWRSHDVAGHGGQFMGVFYSAMHEPLGRLHGCWKAEEPGEGAFMGVWKARCPDWANVDPGWTRWDDENWDPGKLDNDQRMGPGGM